MASVTCIQCERTFSVPPSRVGTAKFCGFDCRGAWRTLHWRRERSARWTGGERTKQCQHCEKMIEWAGEPISTFRKRKFCSKPCADVGGFRRSGKDHPNWTGGNRKRAWQQNGWAERIIVRDKATCRTCGVTGVELHAHHIKSYRDYPELRWQMSNGITLCAPCHWAVHSASNANAVNSGNPQHDQGGGNPEPSLNRKVQEGVTTRGRAYRRVDANCAECGEFISRRASDVIGKTNLFCDKRCMGRYYSRTRRKRPRR